MANAVDDFSDIREAENLDSLTELFEEAADHVKNLMSGLDQSVLLKLYSYYKQATEGSCNIPQPQFFQTKARAKWAAWNKLGNMPKDEAKQHYIKIINELDPNFSQPEKHDSWISVSCLQNTEEEVSESDKTVFDFVKDGNLAKLKGYLSNNDSKKVLNERDDEGLGLIHWASDRGHVDILKYLIELGADVNIVENDGQSPLHYAVCCEHLDCVKVLVEAGANTQLPDSDGTTPADLTNDPEFLSVLVKTL